MPSTHFSEADAVHDNDESPVASVDRALRILALIGGAPRGLSLDDLSARLEIPKSSLHRILAALKYRRFVSQPEHGGAYFLGSELLATAFRFHDMLDLRALVHPLLVRVSDELNETTHMGVLDGAEIVYQDKIEVAAHTIKLSSVIGGRNPAHATGVGKALLAWTYPTDEAVKAWAAAWEPLPQPTPHTVKSAAELADDLARVRERGYSLDIEENEVGVRCAAVPVFLGQPVPAAAVSVTLFGSRADVPRMQELGEYLRGVVADWSKVPAIGPEQARNSIGAPP
jgi:IclR family transcriptional regulator, acetate operon repressor